MVWPIFAALGIAGAILLRIGLRGRRIDDHPLCRRCGFDLTGKPVESTVCAECGSNLADARAIRVGHRQRRRRVMATGGLLLLTGLIGGGWEVLDESQAIQWIKYAPAKLLLYEGQHGEAAWRTEAVRELQDRSQNKLLKPAQISSVVAVALTMQGDASQVWDPLWGDIIEAERGNQNVSDAQWRQYASQALQGAIGLRVRAKIRMGDPAPYWIDEKKGRTAIVTGLRIRLSSRSEGFVGSPLAENGNWTSGPGSFTGGSSTGGVIQPESFPKKMEPGRQQLRFIGFVEVGDAKGTNDIAPVVSQTLDLTAAVDVVPASQPTVKAVANPSLAGAIRAGLSLDLRCNLQHDYGPMSMVQIKSAPAALSFNVYVVINHREHLLGSFACAAGTANSGWGLGSYPTPPFRELFASSQPATSAPATTPHVDVILRSDPMPAVGSTNVFDYWDGVIDFKDLPVTPG